MKPLPMPLVAQPGPGWQPGDDAIDCMPMARETSTCRRPAWPEPRALVAHEGAVAVLHEALGAVLRHLAGAAVAPIELGALAAADLALVNQVLGEGEVAAQVTGSDGIQAQESVFAGVWRVVYRARASVVRDTLEVGAFPRAIAERARVEGRPLPPPPAIAPAGTLNAMAVLEALRDRSRTWRPGQAAHVVNLSLLPLTRADHEYFEQQLGRGRVMVLSRGYGNCRVVDTHVARLWRVTYFNSQDMMILDTLEVGAVPEVACAARQDLEDSAVRLAEVLQWVASA